MSYQSASIGRVYCVRWMRADVNGVNSLLREVQRARALAREPLIGLALLPATLVPPDDITRKAMMRNLQPMLSCLESMHFVVEGTGFRHAIIRTVISGVLILGGKQGRIFVHDSLAEAVGAVGLRADVPGNAILKALSAGGMAPALAATK